jgi:hypothetical protein
MKAARIVYGIAVALSLTWLAALAYYFTSPAPWWLPILAAVTVPFAAVALGLRVAERRAQRGEDVTR